MKAQVILLVTLTLCTACGDGSGGEGGSGGNGPPDSFSVKWGPVEVPAGVESTQCVVKRLGNTEQIRAHEIHNVLGATSHHFIVYRVSDTEERPEPFDCTPFLDTLNPNRGAPLMITQRTEDRLTLPDGVAYTLEPNQMVRLELHYINVSASSQMAEATSTFIPIPEDEFEHAADIIGDISIPPMGTATLGPSYIELPSILDDANFFAVTGHEHQWGTNVHVEMAAGPEDEGVTVYDVPNFQWDEPTTVVHDPPFTVPAGGGFNLTCDWSNGSNASVGFGILVADEMCFFWAYYFPSQGSVVCVKNVFGFSFCCPGPFCDFLPF